MPATNSRAVKIAPTQTSAHAFLEKPDLICHVRSHTHAGSGLATAGLCERHYAVRYLQAAVRAITRGATANSLPGLMARAANKVAFGYRRSDGGFSKTGSGRPALIWVLLLLSFHFKRNPLCPALRTTACCRTSQCSPAVWLVTLVGCTPRTPP